MENKDYEERIWIAKKSYLKEIEMLSKKLDIYLLALKIIAGEDYKIYIERAEKILKKEVEANGNKVEVNN